VSDEVVTDDVDDELDCAETFDDEMLLEVVVDDVVDELDEVETFDDTVFAVDDGSDDVEMLEDVVLLLLLLDEGTCGAEGVAGGVGSSA